MRIFAFCLVALALVGGSAEGKTVQARKYATLEFHLKEIEAALNVAGKKIRLVLNNYKPKGAAEVDESYFEFAGQKRPISIRPVRKRIENEMTAFFSKAMVGASRFEFFVNGVEMEALEFKADDAGIHVSARFSEKGAEIISNIPDMYVINWNRPQLRAYIKPVVHDGKLVVLVRSIKVDGVFEGECKSIVSRCQGVRMLSTEYVNAISGEIEAVAAKFFASEDFQSVVQSGIDSSLSFGDFGRIRIVSLRAASGTIRIQYCAYHC